MGRWRCGGVVGCVIEDVEEAERLLVVRAPFGARDGAL